jgi:serine-type D-Ala-D-Ala carboxypeptidase (penicillin-binding protein 5/6)
MRPTGLLAVLAAGLVLAAPAAASPPRADGARSAIVVDARDGDVLWAKDPDERRAIASTTKMMTALLAIEHARPGERFTAPQYDAAPAESQIHLSAGERMTVHDLLRALLLESANDAAVTIADGVSGSTSAFVGEMNRRAAQLGLSGTHYANPIGLDDPGNYSTARDLAALARRLLRHRRIARIVDMPEAVLRSGARQRVVDNRNDLVARYPFVDGVKTGHTIQAGDVLVGAARRGDAQVVSVVLGEPSEPARDDDTLALLRWGLSQYRRVLALPARRVVARADVKYRDERAELVPARGVALTLRRGERLARRVRAPDELEGPLARGKRVGTVTVLHDGQVVRRVALVTAAPVPGAGTLRIVLSTLGVPLTLLLVLGILVTGALIVTRLRVRLRLVRTR